MRDTSTSLCPHGVVWWMSCNKCEQARNEALRQALDNLKISSGGFMGRPAIGNMDTTFINTCPHGNKLDCYPPCTLCPQRVENTVKTRDASYGGFEHVADIAQQFKRIMQAAPSYSKMTDVQKEGMEMVLHKCARLLAGDPAHQDSWHDIQGYAKLVEDRLLPPLHTVVGLGATLAGAQTQRQTHLAPRADGFSVDGT